MAFHHQVYPIDDHLHSSRRQQFATLVITNKHTHMHTLTNKTGRLSSGCHKIDEFLHGGFLVPGVTEIGGMSAAGKTQLCLQLCLQVQLPVERGGLNSGREREREGRVGGGGEGGWGILFHKVLTSSTRCSLYLY